MRKINVTIIATIMTIFVISMVAFEPTKAKASNNLLPSATPKKIKSIRTTGRVKKPQPKQFTLDGKGTDVNVEEIELYRSKPKTKLKIANRPKGVIESVSTKYTMRKGKRKRH
ncbi:MAG TPA: hypothetical protein PKY82_20990 [Pyrinomonadaceae bacterium]|nr:hypothetical protein [Pyrinomonadaceae bacterium]